MQGISKREFAKRDGCDEARVRRGVARGELETLRDGSINPKLAGTPWRKRARASYGKAAIPAPDTLANATREHQISLANCAAGMGKPFRAVR